MAASIAAAAAAALLPHQEGAEHSVQTEPLPVKNTFIHFNGRQRTLRVCITDPDDPVLLPRKQHQEGEQGRFDTIRSEACDDSDDAASQTTDAVSGDDLAVATPELTPRHMESPTGGSSGAASIIMETPSPNVCQDGLARLALGESTLNASAPAWNATAGSYAWPLPVVAPPPPVPMTMPQPSPGCSGMFPPTPSAATPPSEGGLFRFSFTLRLAEAGALGITWADDAAGENGQSLRVAEVLPESAIAAWNRQCLEGVRTKAVAADDVLVEVNGKADPAGMRAECDSKLLLKLTFVKQLPAVAPPAAGTKVCLRIHSALQGEGLHACVAPVRT